MTSRLGKKEKIILVSGSTLVLIVFVFCYFLFIFPVKTKVQQREIELVNQQKLLEVVKNKDSESPKQLMESSVQLQKQIPVKPLIEQFIIDLEMAETISNSRIVSISFSDSGAGTDTSYDPNTTQTPQTTDGSETPENESGVEVIPKPEGIKEITLDLSIESTNYFDLEKFISTLEKLDRIVEVKSINFSGPPEITSIGTATSEELTKTSFQLSLAIYYFPKLADLADDLPKIQVETPANKSNPLSNFSDVTDVQDSKK